MVVQIYLAAAGFLAVGLLWFFIVRPMLEDFGVIARGEDVNTIPDVAPHNLTEVESMPAPVQTSSELVRINENIPTSKTVLTDAELAAVLAPLKKVDGSWWLSANKIHEIVGGQRADVLAVVRAARPELAPSNDDRPARAIVVRDRSGEHRIPIERRERYYDDPELEYRAPGV